MIKKNGFTIFEILIVIGIITLLSGLTVSYYNNYSENEKLQNETQKFISVLSLASKKSQVAELAEEEPCSTEGNEFIGYLVYIESENKYILQKNCTGAEVSDIKEYYLPGSLKFVQPLDTTILYKKLSQGILINGVSRPEIIIIRSESLNTKNCVNISINKAGVIISTVKTDCNN